MTLIPGAILWFSRLWIGSIFLEVLATIMTWGHQNDESMAKDVAALLSFTEALLFTALIALSLFLWWRVIRQRSRLARLMITIMSFIFVILYVADLSGLWLSPDLEMNDLGPEWHFVFDVAFLLSLIANALLFAPGAQRWFAREPEFSDVFS